MRRVLLEIFGIFRTARAVLLPPSCRFVPTCSEYAHQAVTRYGVASGVWLTLRRLLRCHPFHPGGLDPVPTR